MGQHTERVTQSGLTCWHARAGHTNVIASADLLPLGMELSVCVSVAVLLAALGGEDAWLPAHLLFRSDKSMLYVKLEEHHRL